MRIIIRLIYYRTPHFRTEMSKRAVYSLTKVFTVSNRYPNIQNMTKPIKNFDPFTLITTILPQLYFRQSL